MKGIDRTNRDTVGVFTSNAVIGDNKSHTILRNFDLISVKLPLESITHSAGIIRIQTLISMFFDIITYDKVM